MKCPHCNATLVMADKQGVEIDYCPECRGIWLDRGELEKIIERSNTAYYPDNRRNDHYEEHRYEKSYKHDHDDNHYGYGNYKKHHKRSFLEDIFDFG